LQASPHTAGWRFVRHEQVLASNDWLSGARTVINCAFDPRLKSGPYDSEHDIDLHIAAQLRNWPAVHYVMLSSRLAYGPAPGDLRLHEGMTATPDRHYGKAKLTTERALQGLLGDRLTVLRLSNVFGDEAWPGRQSFFASAMRSLKDHGRIVLDISPFVERDFIPVQELAVSLVRIASAPRPGLFNLGAGCATPTGRVAQWLIEGFGGGVMLVSDLREFDAFRLDIAAARAAFAIEPVSPAVVRERCTHLGARLRDTVEATP
jgi:nucleoside-diphosphate-sugar epimerase